MIEFDSVILQRNPCLTDVQVEKEREKSFATWLRYQDNEQEEIDPNALEREVEYDEEEESPDDEDEFEEDDEDDAELDISSASDDEYRQYYKILVRLPVHAGRPYDRDRLPVYVSRPGDRAIIQQNMRRGLSYLDAIHVGFLRPMDSWKEFPPSVWELLFDMFTRYVFTRPEDLPRARDIWESTPQTNFRKSMWKV
ncbi:hypothetical protein Taro_040244 [Colocasia esculenta]|uniref:Uncharacterized protein n=1 Tax=Colocasia esculenta TaxID=4460 RepID=A0A843WPQ5_COLES|nr:hypothetical protein [Colocasia esculenta]